MIALLKNMRLALDSAQRRNSRMQAELSRELASALQPFENEYQTLLFNYAWKKGSPGDQDRMLELAQVRHQITEEVTRSVQSRYSRS